MDATRSAGIGRPWSDPYALVPEVGAAHVDGIVGADPADVDDVWPLELWFSREDALSDDDDTWHAEPVRQARSHARRRRRWWIW
jgi:hypothetical protein